MNAIKLPMQQLLVSTLDDIKRRGDVTQAVVILLNARTSDAKIGAMHGDLNGTIDAVEKVLAGMKKHRAGKSGIIVPN